MHIAAMCVAQCRARSQQREPALKKSNPLFFFLREKKGKRIGLSKGRAFSEVRPQAKSEGRSKSLRRLGSPQEARAGVREVDEDVEVLHAPACVLHTHFLKESSRESGAVRNTRRLPSKTEKVTKMDTPQKSIDRKGSNLANVSNCKGDRISQKSLSLSLSLEGGKYTEGPRRSRVRLPLPSRSRRSRSP